MLSSRLGQVDHHRGRRFRPGDRDAAVPTRHRTRLARHGFRRRTRSHRRAKIVDWYMDGKIRIDELITHNMPLDKINEPSTDARGQVDPQRGNLLIAGVVPAKRAFSAFTRVFDALGRARAGTHTPQSIERARRIGTRLRGDDTSLFLANPARAIERLVGAVGRVKGTVGLGAGAAVAFHKTGHGRSGIRRRRVGRVRRALGAEPARALVRLPGAVRGAEGHVGSRAGIDVALRRRRSGLFRRGGRRLHRNGRGRCGGRGNDGARRWRCAQLGPGGPACMAWRVAAEGSTKASHSSTTLNMVTTSTAA